ncbi:signal recognition particle 68 kDa subunit [Heterostelium album PN500]|uniref:Signal recognition particle subunit SRP68 n=1 Tax=Heterostelium pallidum (strain ATCC 26659 / Pp 5 / PN500) TaxID=670386 RepID=D3AWZ9_HETP5|nr:signal recognition particle 68 kDa subunit [Heterostelium album PN500]EFA86822.1 signal recognition particle 68 kDa subunit [Heterostelium album PN500]|eukprot:XP_020438925.1 signal recognition particle 68 kDa subunit [Heterostelium album PN500]
MATPQSPTESETVATVTSPTTAAAAVVAPTQKFSLDILNISQTSQIQNGLRQDDFTAYRQYCTRRLGRIRSSMKKQLGKKNYIAKLNDPKNIVDARYLLIVLIKTERAWAYARALKQEYEQSDQGRLKFHMNSRFAKAAVHADQLERFCREVADQYTQIEAAAYAAWIRSSHMIACSRWLEALEAITKAKTIYSSLATSGTPSLKQLYVGRVEDAEPIERFCLYNMRSLDTSSNSTVLADTTKILKKVTDDTEKKTNQILSNSSSSSNTGSKQQQEQPMSTVSWRQRQVRVNEKVREKLVNYSNFVKEYDAATSDDAKFPLYEKIVKQLLDAEVMVRNELVNIVRVNIKNKTVKSEVEESDLRALLAYISYHKYRYLYNRNETLINQYTQSADNSSSNKQQTTVVNSGGKKKKISTRDIIRILTNQIKVYSRMIENRNEQRQDAVLEAQLQLLKATRLYHIANGLALAKKWSETMATAERVSSMIATARKNKNADVVKRADELDKLVASIRSQVHANAFIEQMSNNEDLKRQMSELSLSSGGDNNSAAVASKDLLSGLDNFDTSFLAEKRLVEFPPPLQPAPTKPLFFDLAFNQCQFPSLEARKKSTQPQSKGLFGFFR